MHTLGCTTALLIQLYSYPCASFYDTYMAYSSTAYSGRLLLSKEISQELPFHTANDLVLRGFY